MPNWDSPDIVEWLKKATDNQQYYCDRLDDRDYDSFSGNDKKYLKIKIAFSLFGSPSNVDENKNEVEITAYTKEQQESSNRIFEQIIAYSSDEIQVAFIFLMVKQNEQQYQVPLIRFVASEKYQETEHFVDHYGRVYKSWNDFTEWNELPECLYCFPDQGWYKTDENGRVKVDKTTSPRCNVGERVVKYADITSTVANVGSLVLLGVGLLCPPAAPVCLPAATWIGAGSGVYGVARNTTKLVDRGVHGQSVNPIGDAQARNCWLGTAGGALGVGTLGTARYITYLAREGEVASKVLRVTFNTLEISSLAVNGVGIVSNIVELSQKESVTALDVASLSLNILFFTNSVVSLKTARTIIKDTQTQVIDTSKSKMDQKAQEGFRAFTKQNKKELRSTMYGNGKTIKSLKKIDSPNQFFSDLQQVRVDVRTANAANGASGNIKVRVNNDLLVSMSGELKVHPSKWQTVQLESRTKLLDCAQKITSNPKQALDYIKEVEMVCSKERLTFERTRQSTMKLLAEKFGVPDATSIKINGERVFQNLRPHQIDRIGNVLQAFDKHGNKEFFQCVTDVAKDLGFKSPGELMGIAEYCYGSIHEIRHKADGAKPSFADVVNKLNTDTDEMQRLVEKFRHDQSIVSPLNENASPGFASDAHATYHYHKHNKFGPKGQISPEQYFDIIQDITGRDDLKSNTVMVQEGNKQIVTFCNPDDGAKCIVLEPLMNVENDSVIVATLFYDKKIKITRLRGMDRGHLYK